VQTLVQSQAEPGWAKTFADLQVLEEGVCKAYEPQLENGRAYRFRLLANPTVKKTVEKDGKEKHKTRLGIMGEAEQRVWLERKLKRAGAEVLESRVVRNGMQYAYKGGQKEEEGRQAHLAVLYEGVLRAIDAALLKQAVESGIGSGKGYGLGLLSLGHV
jgi:CRISPR system Cascade subunit CasE